MAKAIIIMNVLIGAIEIEENDLLIQSKNS